MRGARMKARMQKGRPKDSPGKIDPSRASIYVALIGLVSAVAVAIISNPGKDVGKAESPPASHADQAEKIISSQRQRLELVKESLDRRAEQAEQLVADLPEPEKRPDEAARRKAADAARYLKTNGDTKAAVTKMHGDAEKVLREGNFSAFNDIRTEVNERLREDGRAFSGLPLPNTIVDLRVTYTLYRHRNYPIDPNYPPAPADAKELLRKCPSELIAASPTLLGETQGAAEPTAVSWGGGVKPRVGPAM